jgi:hypothetical protein
MSGDEWGEMTNEERLEERFGDPFGGMDMVYAALDAVRGSVSVGSAVVDWCEELGGAADVLVRASESGALTDVEVFRLAEDSLPEYVGAIVDLFRSLNGYAFVREAAADIDGFGGVDSWEDMSAVLLWFADRFLLSYVGMMEL